MAQTVGSLDTNVVLRLLLNDEPSQHTAAAKLLEINSGQFAVADLVVTEVVFALGRYYNFSRPQIAEAVSGLMQLPIINCNRALFERALALFEAHHGLSFEDCCLAVYAELNQAEPLYTFDRKLANQAPNAKLVTT
jgi:predicted nucleic-acid-binding protein